MKNSPEPSLKRAFCEFLVNVSKNFHKIRLFDINFDIKEVDIGGKIYKIEDGAIILEDGNKVHFVKDDKGNPIFLKDGTEISFPRESKNENVKLLDKEQKVFSRADISEVQLELLTIEEKHEKIIKHFRRFLENYGENMHIGALLIAGTIIRLEDAKNKDEGMIRIYNEKKKAYKEIGHMVYNLFRSKILEKEIMPYSEKLLKDYSLEEAKQIFLVTWRGYITDGYPTAYFMQYDDNEVSLFKQFNWRFNRQVPYVEVYSRGNMRNKLTKKLCKLYCEKNPDFKMEVKEPYILGLSNAIIIHIEKNKK